jgi:hypothetical protein
MEEVTGDRSTNQLPFALLHKLRRKSMGPPKFTLMELVFLHGKYTTPTFYCIRALLLVTEISRLQIRLW